MLRIDSNLTMRRLGVATLIAAGALALPGCGSTRFAGLGDAAVPAARAAPSPPPIVDEPPVSAVPSGSVSSEPLAPLGPSGSPPPASAPELRPAAPPQQSANAAPSSRSSAFGSWTAREATGTTCRVQLSSAPALDLYKASSSGCSNRDLSKITAWDYREGEVFLYQPGGTMAARLRSGAGAMDGVLTKSGAPLSMVR